MKIRSIIFIISIFLCIPQAGKAQVRNLLKTKSKTTEKEENINKKFEKGVSNLSKRLFNQAAGEEESEAELSDSLSAKETEEYESNDDINEGGGAIGKAFSSMISSGGSNIDHEESYSFDHSIKMEIEGEEVEGQGKLYFTSYFDSKSNDVAVAMESMTSTGGGQEGAQIITIMDFSNKCGVMLTNQGSQKMALITNMEEDGTDDSESIEEVEENYDYNKTGRTKSILGYKCYEYTYSDSEGRGEFWLTDELKFKMDRKTMEKSGIPAIFDGREGFDGMVMMEMIAYESDAQTSHMLVTEVNTKANITFSLSGYNKISIGDGQDY